MNTRLNSPEQRYSDIAILLHWLMAFSIGLMLVSGVVMSYAPLTESLQFRLYQWHKSLGVLLLIIGLVRILVRVLAQYRKRIPPLPSSLKRIDVLAAHAGHFGLYTLMLLMPLSGWVMVSASVLGLPTFVFNWFEWPHLPGIPRSQSIEDIAYLCHFYGAIFLGVLLVGHIGAVIKHLVFERINLMPRILWPAFPARMSIVVTTALLTLSIALNIISGSSPSKTEDAVQLSDNGNYKVLYGDSKIRFSGLKAGDPFEGYFQRWQARLDIDLQDLPSSSVSVTFDMSSATTGDAIYDGTLTETDWFDIAQFPTATFETTQIKLDRDKGFIAMGNLTIKGITRPITLLFTTSDLQVLPITLKTELEIDRLAYEIGLAADPKAEWVSRAINLGVKLKVTQ